MAFLTSRELDTIAEAVRTAEAHTSGEIVTVIAARSDDYLWPVLLPTALIAVLLPGFVAPYLGIVSAADLFFIQLAALLAVQILLLVPQLRIALVPASVKRAQARRRAREQFFERGLHLTQGRTGVLIFVSVAEHCVEILADRGIDEKVDAGTWQGIVDAFVAEVRARRVSEGFMAAIRDVGAVLAQHFPTEGKNPNELPDRLFVI